MIEQSTSRRSLLALLGAGLGTLAVPAIAAPARKAAAKPMMTMYRDPGCGCCEAWAVLARRAGYPVKIVATTDMPAVKARAGLPSSLASCHTTIVGGYVVEGHVPFDAIAKLLRTRPRIHGIAVPGMPLGSPGMETADGSRDAFVVMAFTKAGQITRFQA